MIHKHHIVPKYRCKELGIDPDFDDNFAEVTREQHALIHWGYKCNDLSPLLEVCSPPQYVLDMIPLGDNRDSGAAALIALGEIEQIDMSGENHPAYKHGYNIGRMSSDREVRRLAERNRDRNDPKRKVVNKRKYAKLDKKRNQTPERKAWIKEYRAKQRVKKKAEKQGKGTLDSFL